MMATQTITAALLADTAGYSPVQVWIRLGLILVLMLVLAGIAAMIRKRVMSQDDTPPIGFTLKDLRDMHAAGQISDEELAVAEAKTLSQTRSAYLGDEADDDPGEEVEDLGDISLGSDSEQDQENPGPDSDKNP